MTESSDSTLASSVRGGPCNDHRSLRRVACQNLPGRETAAKIIDADRIRKEASDSRRRFVMQHEREAVIRREIVHKPRQFPEDGIDIVANVL